MDPKRCFSFQNQASALSCYREARAVALLTAALIFSAHAIGRGDERVHRITPDQNFQLALEAQSERDYKTMLKLLRLSAETGHVEAQEMLGLVLLVGPTLYGNSVKIDHCEAGAWMRRSAQQGSDIGMHQLTFLNRLRPVRSGKDICPLAW